MSRNAFLNAVVFAAILFGSVCVGHAISVGPADKIIPLDQDFARFVIEKQTLAKRLGETHDVAFPSVIWDFFDATQKGDFLAASNHFSRIESSRRTQEGGPWTFYNVWGAIHDTFGAYEQFRAWTPEMLHRFGDKVMAGIPEGSIYFGGTDAGRFVISALSVSHSEGRPFFTLTQNALADGVYLDYLRDIYGEKINLPTLQESQRAFNEYLVDVQKRSEKKQLKEGENFKIVEGRVQVSALVSVMAINEILVRQIIDKNPSREIFLEESYVLESLYGQSLPHGMIFKVNHKPLEQLPRSMIEADHQFWTAECRALIGKAVQDETSVGELCVRNERVILRPQSSGFEGNPAYLKDAQAPQNYSQCRSAIAVYYQWWSKKSEKSQSANLTKEADFAYRQSVALSPYNPAVTWRYAEFLLGNQRTNDAKILIESTLKMNPEKRMDLDSAQLKDAMKKLRAEAKKLSVNDTNRYR